jgi:glycine/D-amino acid oxidase-like deaminating enzyme
MDIKPGFPFWLVKNGILADFPKLTRNLEQEEIVIIGSGISGALAAHELCSAGFKCTILDKRMLTSGTTWASTGQMSYEIDSTMLQLARQYGEAFAVGVYDASLQALYDLKRAFQQAAIDPGVEPKSSLYLASDKKGLKGIGDEYKLRTKHGFPVNYLDAGDLEKEYGLDRRGALHHEFAAQMDTYRAAVGLILHHVIRQNLTVYTRTAVTGMQVVGNKVVLVTEEGFRIKARYVVCAPGSEAGMFLPRKVMSLYSTFALVTQPVPADLLWKDQCLIWETCRPYFYIRVTQDNRLMMGGEDMKFRKGKGMKDALVARKAKAVLNQCRRLFPQIPVKPEFSWFGVIGETKDGLPYIGQFPGMKHVYFALGHGGNGTTFSMIAAQLIRNQICGKMDYRKKLFAFNR